MSAKPEQAQEQADRLAWQQSKENLHSRVPPLCWPFPPGSQNQTDKAVRLKPYVPPKRRSLNQF